MMELNVIPFMLTFFMLSDSYDRHKSKAFSGLSALLITLFHLDLPIP